MSKEVLKKIAEIGQTAKAQREGAYSPLGDAVVALGLIEELSRLLAEEALVYAECG